MRVFTLSGVVLAGLAGLATALPADTPTPSDLSANCNHGQRMCVGDKYTLICVRGKWEHSKTCADTECCAHGYCTDLCSPESNKGADATCPPGVGPPAGVGVAVDGEKDIPVDIKSLDLASLPRCRHGETMCLGEKYVLVCKRDDHWEYKDTCTECSRNGCCTDVCHRKRVGLGDGVDGGKDASVNFDKGSVAKRDDGPKAVATDYQLPGKRCRPGTFYCQKLAAKGKPDVDAVFTCGLDGVGRLSALCGYGGCCTEFPDKGTAYCTCFTDPGDLPELEPTISPREVDAATGPNSVIAPQADCTPGEYVCLQLPGRHGPKGSAVHVCTAEHKWQLSAFCGGINCCEEGSIPGTAYCTCANDEGTLIKRTTLPPAANPDVASSASECTPGTFKCGLLYDRVAPIGSAVFACNLKGLWVQSANCGPLNCCQQGPTPETAFCTCGRPSTSEVSSGPTDESSSLRLRATSDVTETSLAECTPGNFKCDFLPVGHGDNNSGRMRVAIFACSPEGNWRVSAVCDCCRHGPQPGTAYCYCLPSAEQSSLPAGEDTLSKRATLPRGEPESDVTTTEAECTPAIYKCEPVGGWPPNNLFTAIYTCDALGYWQFSVVCPGGPECCREGRSRKTAHCTCGPALQDLPELQNRSLSVSRRQNPNPDDLVDDNGRSPGRCTPGTYMCQYSKSQPTQSHVTVCTPVGECRISASCGPAHCCQRGGPGAFCVCKNPKAHALEIDPTSIVSELGDVSSDTQSLLKRQKPPTVPTCIPGTSFCAKGVVYNCDSNGKSTPSVRCGSSDDCCQRGAIPGTAYCVCGASAMEQLSNEEKISLEEEQFSIAEHEAVQDSPSANSKREASPQEKVPFNSPQGISKCQPGYSYCIDGTIHNCNIAGNLIMSVQCGRNPDCCITGPTPGTAFCVCGAGSIEQLSTEKQLSIEGQSMTLSTVKAVPTKA